MLTTIKRHRPYLSVAAGLIYGLCMRLIFHFWSRIMTPFRSFRGPSDVWVMSFGFLILAPFVIGWIALYFAGFDNEKRHWSRWILLPWIPIVTGNLVVLVTGVEGRICVVFAFPILLLSSSLGGIAAGLVARRRRRHGSASTLCLAIVPFLVSALESRCTGPLELRTADTSVLIHAPASAVWQNIKRVSAISPSEIRPTWAHRIGFPLPVEATLDREGVGGVRHASFEGGLMFIETINVWQPEQRIGFRIAADTRHIPATTLDEHVKVGGPYFDVLYGEYWLEPVGDGNVLLHLTSRERLNTDFNGYAGLWSDFVMCDLQQSILEVVKHRSEAAAGATK